MNAISKTKTVDAILGTVADASNATWYGDIETASPVTAKTNEPVKLTFFARFVARFVALFEIWTQNSYDSWVKDGKQFRG